VIYGLHGGSNGLVVLYRSGLQSSGRRTAGGDGTGFDNTVRLDDGTRGGSGIRLGDTAGRRVRR